MWLGSIEKVGTIPPQSAHFSASECKVRLRPGCEEVQVVASLPHAHSTGVAVWSELYNRSADGELTYVRLPDITLQPLVCRLLHRIGAARLCNRAAVDTLIYIDIYIYMQRAAWLCSLPWHCNEHA